MFAVEINCCLGGGVPSVDLLWELCFENLFRENDGKLASETPLELPYLTFDLEPDSDISAGHMFRGLRR